jgi:hypothetical protein
MFTAQCHVADWCNRLAEVWPCLPLSFSFTKAVTRIRVRELSNTTSYRVKWNSHISSAQHDFLLRNIKNVSQHIPRQLVFEIHLTVNGVTYFSALSLVTMCTGWHTQDTVHSRSSHHRMITEYTHNERCIIIFCNRQAYTAALGLYDMLFWSISSICQHVSTSRTTPLGRSVTSPADMTAGHPQTRQTPANEDAIIAAMEWES